MAAGRRSIRAGGPHYDRPVKAPNRFQRPAGRRQRKGERLGGYVYGTIVVISTVIAGAKAYREDVGHVAALVLVTTVIFWLAHVYAHALAHSVAQDEHLSWAALSTIARRESSIIGAAVGPVVALLLGHLGVVSERASVWLAIACGLAVLVTQGIAFARAERLGRLSTMAIVAVNHGLGLTLVGLKLWVSHGHW